jgi:putative transposase
VVSFLLSLLAVVSTLFRSRIDNSLEILALRQQIAVLQRRRRQPPLNQLDRLFWMALRRLWPRWSQALVLVKPATVISWHRAGFRLFWRWRSRARRGLPKISKELRFLILRMARENTGWGAPRIHGELLKLGFLLSERTVARYLRGVRRRRDPDQRWRAFLHNHREAIVAMDFLSYPP